ncbi:hypothetical protein MBM_08982 [Drepanopeziza brunnea f. sp. 'multigermtubi' MB_m1]|uniref:Uncharacterized protein n=1 Tax=Marssonina brunnea f. sp. multigermtubi (strain MB_m1) TaxID=1072389 RepID=K1WVQ1_MARBU|nr:uncharacterized protein MBM_08982 [Drepanopeziza brunnea f. sp. 'multigermtubi' MB_m1]EKD12753.1 hypothetical protein MBM_08982 [Drepanopeziza brunnea f. sp. 'multigermtubi' MB_m1]
MATSPSRNRNTTRSPNMRGRLETIPENWLQHQANPRFSMKENQLNPPVITQHPSAHNQRWYKLRPGSLLRRDGTVLIIAVAFTGLAVSLVVRKISVLEDLVSFGLESVAEAGNSSRRSSLEVPVCRATQSGGINKRRLYNAEDTMEEWRRTFTEVV